MMLPEMSFDQLRRWDNKIKACCKEIQAVNNMDGENLKRTSTYCGSVNCTTREAPY